MCTRGWVRVEKVVPEAREVEPGLEIVVQEVMPRIRRVGVYYLMRPVEHPTSPISVSAAP